MPARPDIPARVARIRELAEAGAKASHIAQRMRLSMGTVIVVMREHKIKLGPWSPERKARWEAYTRAERDGGLDGTTALDGRRQPADDGGGRSLSE